MELLWSSAPGAKNILEVISNKSYKLQGNKDSEQFSPVSFRRVTKMTDVHSLEADTSAVEPAEPPSSKAIVDLANHLLKEFNISTQIEDVCDITASLFVVLYESLFSDRLPGIIRQPLSKEDEVLNCQIVIDVLSTEVVKDSLSHIRGADIVAGDSTAILNLLDIFSYLLEYVVKRIENEAEEAGSISTTEPEQVVTRGSLQSPAQKLKDIPKSKLDSAAASNTTNNNGAHLEASERNKVYIDRNDNRREFERRDIITHEDFYAMSYGGISTKNEPVRPPSPIKPDMSHSLLCQRTVDSDFDTDAEKSEKKALDYFKDGPKIAWEAEGPTETVIDGVTLRAHTQPVKGAPWESSAYSDERPIPSFSASMPAYHSHTELSRSDPLRATVGPISYHSYATGLKDEAKSHIPAAKGLSSSYNDLRELVEKTAALTRVALATSPVRTRTALDLDITDTGQDRPRPVISSNGARLAKKLNAESLNSAVHKDASSPEKSGKKVAFASLRDSGIHDYDYRQDLQSALSPRWQPLYEGYSSDIESDNISRESPPIRGRQTALKGQHKVPKSKAGGQKKISAGANRQQFAKYLAQNRQPELGAAHMTLKTEDRAIRRKQEILKKFYEQDHQEFAEDVEYMLERDRQRSKELEEEFVKKCTQGSLKKKAKSGKAQALKKPRNIKHTSPRSKGKEAVNPASALPFHLDSEEDLLPLLLEEFPHLHLSEHTWHELWRKGLHQIEALTRAHEESQRKKSRAQCQGTRSPRRHSLWDRSKHASPLAATRGNA
ncbi:centrosomal protein of 95 kda [Plakobranchus ocellatus]|uniref:Centrosomal protein of 95 kDa n=1 Tax=Plakobranchus ocellatus TaxID=259542 RepID=A0AAV3YIB0_9GAST|nr:centrosomal protein of 95 kda [Plakobranchus ocellatus]